MCFLFTHCLAVLRINVIIHLSNINSVKWRRYWCGFVSHSSDENARLRAGVPFTGWDELSLRRSSLNPILPVCSGVYPGMIISTSNRPTNLRRASTVGAIDMQGGGGWEYEPTAWMHPSGRLAVLPSHTIISAPEERTCLRRHISTLVNSAGSGASTIAQTWMKMAV